MVHRDELKHLVNPGRVGIIVSCDPKIEHIEAMFDGKLEPVAVLFRSKDGRNEVRYPTREVTEEEAVAMVNKYLADGRIRFGFEKVSGPPRPQLLG